jgi:hypothetical protein
MFKFFISIVIAIHSFLGGTAGKPSLKPDLTQTPAPSVMTVFSPSPTATSIPTLSPIPTTSPKPKLKLKPRYIPAPTATTEPSLTPLATPTPAPTVQNTTPPIYTEDPALKIARCQADTKALVDSYITKAYKMAEDSFNPMMLDADNKISEATNKYYDALMAMTPENERILSPSQQDALRQGRADVYKTQIDYWQSVKQNQLLLLQRAKDKADQLFGNGYDNLYAECLKK